MRLALGARTRSIRDMVLRQGLRPVAVGIGAGLALAAATTGLLRSLLFGVGPLDPGTFAGAALLLMAAATLACLLPASRAARIDPAATLRLE